MDTKFVQNIISGIKEIDLKPSGEKNIDTGERALSLIMDSYLLYKSLKSITRHPLIGIQGAAASGLLIYRGATGVCPVYKKLDIDTTDPQAINISETITVNASREKVYAFWRELSNLPKFMQHLKEVTETSDTESHWIANTPGNLIPLSWNAEITHEETGSYLGWQSTEGSMVENAGKVEFTDTLNSIGTQLHIEINYFPPAGSVGRGIASLFNGMFEKMIRADIQNFKAYAEQADFRAYAGLSMEEY
ncbi:DUF2892 domain-containing protein [Pedobacter polaris]|uniref:DUF2892 domain-containing protein n=2 Tax=Pedobacter polaris TaxID=2571273 RepID=A0A4U1CT31_9SPHI|nr:DUF2892 domain-containing protein [Pedobacter polaris]